MEMAERFSWCGLPVHLSHGLGKDGGKAEVCSFLPSLRKHLLHQACQFLQSSVHPRSMNAIQSMLHITCSVYAEIMYVKICHLEPAQVSMVGNILGYVSRFRRLLLKIYLLLL